MRHGSLFSGIGGFDISAQWMGWENVFHCEWNPFGQKVLKYYWPNAIRYNDITKSDFTIHRGEIDILTGGFPCQPYSAAGKRLGKEDDRHLWPEMLRAIREIQPTWIVGENVRGLTNWNGGLVFDEVQADLESEGYEVTPFLLPACAVNAPHRRDRIWFVAFKDSNCNGRRSEFREKEPDIREFRNISAGDNEPISTNNGKTTGARLSTTDTKSKRSKRLESSQQSKISESKQVEFRGSDCQDAITDTNNLRQPGEEYRKNESRQLTKTGVSDYWENFPTQSPICTGNDELSKRLDGITFPKWRNESIKAAGNAVVPSLVYQIFKAIDQYGQLD